MTDEEPMASDLDDRAESGRSRERRGTGISKWSLLLLALAIALAVILGQNTDKVDVDVLWASFRAPLFLVVILAGLGFTVLWEVGTLVLRHRRRQAQRT